jgi:hypothetical protein
MDTLSLYSYALVRSEQITFQCDMLLEYLTQQEGRHGMLKRSDIASVKPSACPKETLGNQTHKGSSTIAVLLLVHIV